MIYIKETFPDQDSVAVHVQGFLDFESLSALEEVCHRRMKTRKHISLHLEGVVDSCREAIEFLRDIEGKVILVDPPEFMGLGRPEP